MIVDAQDDIIQGLSQPQTYGSSVQSVDRRFSHLSIVFLAGDKAYKLKRAVLYPQADFSTPEKRRLACVQEMKRSTVYAPHLVIGIKPVRRLKNGRIVLGGRLGEEVDTVLVMRRIPDDQILSNVLPTPTFDRFEAMDLAERLADLHQKAKTMRAKWSVDHVRQLIADIIRTAECFCPALFSKSKLEDWTAKVLAQLQTNASLISFRQKAGHVRKCHGDLKLSNIAWDSKNFLFFSPVEYNGLLDSVDTLYDLACLTMDLEVKGLRRLSNICFNHYMAYMNDMAGFPLLALYQSLRAMIHAVVLAYQSTLLPSTERKNARMNARKYFGAALHFIAPFKPVLIACGGLSGSGKSRVAREIGGFFNPAPGAIILRDDIVRKQMLGIAPHEALDKDCMTPAFEKVVYDILRQQARTALSGGSCVIIDALFYNPVERQAVELLAKDMNVDFFGFWMEAPLSMRAERVASRKRNPSDIRKGCELESQLNLKTGRISWHRISTAGPKEETVRKVLRFLKKHVAAFARPHRKKTNA